MKVLLIHNYYQQRGGEDSVFLDEALLLESHGHEVIRYTLHNDSVNTQGRLQLARRTLWNESTYRELRKLIRREQPRLMHCTNTFPLISPAAYYAANRERVPVVQTLHNYRLLCPKAVLMRDGKVCEECLHKLIPWPAVKYGCYRDDRLATAVVAGMLTAHRAIGTFRRCIDRYITLSQFSRDKFIEAGFPAGKLAVKPNFVAEDLGPARGEGGHVVFVGRLSAEKGIETLLRCWTQNPALPPLHVIGDGPLRAQVEESASTCANIVYRGHQPTAAVLRALGDAGLTVVPSINYETFGKVIIESFSRGTPVVASKMGAMAELIRPSHTGSLFEPGDANGLATAVTSLVRKPEQLAAMRIRVREEFEHHYTANRNFQLLMQIYADALGSYGNTATANQDVADIVAAESDAAGPLTTESDAEDVEATVC